MCWLTFNAFGLFPLFLVCIPFELYLVMAGSALKELENDKGIIIRYVIGRSSNRGDMLDRQIDQESKETNDFLILVLN